MSPNNTQNPDDEDRRDDQDKPSPTLVIPPLADSDNDIGHLTLPRSGPDSKFRTPAEATAERAGVEQRLAHRSKAPEIPSTPVDFGNNIRSLNSATVKMLTSEEGFDYDHAFDKENHVNATGEKLYRASWDPYGNCPNIGPGLTRGITMNTILTKNEIGALKEGEWRRSAISVMKAEMKMKRRMGMSTADISNPNVRVFSDNMFGALVDFDYNVGGGATSKVMDAPGAVDANGKLHPEILTRKMREYNRAGGQYLKVLDDRRGKEERLALTSDAPAPSLNAVADAVKNGNILVPEKPSPYPGNRHAEIKVDAAARWNAPEPVSKAPTFSSDRKIKEDGLSAQSGLKPRSSTTRAAKVAEMTPGFHLRPNGML